MKWIYLCFISFSCRTIKWWAITCQLVLRKVSWCRSTSTFWIIETTVWLCLWDSIIIINTCLLTVLYRFDTIMLLMNNDMLLKFRSRPLDVTYWTQIYCPIMIWPFKVPCNEVTSWLKWHHNDKIAILKLYSLVILFIYLSVFRIASDESLINLRELEATDMI